MMVVGSGQTKQQKGTPMPDETRHFKPNLDANPFKAQAYKSPFEKYQYWILDESGRLRGGADSMEKAISTAKTQSFFRPVRVIQKDTDTTIAVVEEGIVSE
jgi:hypothetical protein